MEYDMRFLFGLIVVVVGIVVGLALMGPMSKTVFAAEASWNCSSSSGTGHVASRLPCTIASLYVPFFVIGIFMSIGGLLMFKRRPEEQYGYGGYDQYGQQQNYGYQDTQYNQY